MLLYKAPQLTSQGAFMVLASGINGTIFIELHAI